ncbi:hypothetical protein [Pedobacter nototheniae]|uniref:hypothetical protein n=1 Tax=Pedobacter nototheniae TaxID=2488994 RepID=UPI001B8AF488|nr:hypothetical protein [Pedobacter nototheniae]
MKNQLKFTVTAVTVFVTLLSFNSCKKQEVETTQSASLKAKSLGLTSTNVALTVQTVENFEVGAISPKTAYDVSPAGSAGGDDVTLNGKSWNLFDALIGNLDADKKNGSWSARVRNSGKITMQFDITTGINTVSIQHATYGNNTDSQWGLWYSTNSGSSWTQSGVNITSTSTMQTQLFTLNLTGNVRLEIRKLSGASNRINFDDITIGNSDGGTNPGTNPVITGKKFLFDASKLENAGSADWQIDADGTEKVPSYTGGTTSELAAQRFPTPSYTGITASTPETYWKGAMSAWAVELVKRGELVETLPVGTAITYGDTSNPQDLKNYDVYVVIEPNKLFTTSEKAAIMNFVANGGGLMMVADHTAASTAGADANGYNPSDRDGDGYDSPRVWNDLMSNNGINNNKPFGFNVDYVDISEKPSTNVYTGTNTSANIVLNGAAGNASKLAFYNGTTATLFPLQNAAVQGLFWKMSSTLGGNNGVMALISTYGSGRVAFVGDSSASDDGTGDTNDNLFNGWSGDVPSGYTSHPALHLNASLWLAKAQ